MRVRGFLRQSICGVDIGIPRTESYIALLWFYSSHQLHPGSNTAPTGNGSSTCTLSVAFTILRDFS